MLIQKVSLLNQTLKISFRFCHIFLLVKVSPLITNEPHYPAYTQPVKRQEEERGRGQFNRLTGTVQNPLIITHFNHPSESHKEIKAIKGLRQRTVKIPLVFKRWMPRAFPKVLSKILSMTVGICWWDYQGLLAGRNLLTPFSIIKKWNNPQSIRSYTQILPQSDIF